MQSSPQLTAGAELPPAPGDDAGPAASPLLHWYEEQQPRIARWRSERGARPPARIVVADDTISADQAYRLACEGTGLVWRGDFQNARQLLQALMRRTDRPASRAAKKAPVSATTPASGRAQAFHLHRQSQAQRARVLSMLLIEFGDNYRIALRRAPDVRQACEEAWGPTAEGTLPSVCAMRELLGLVSAHQWRRKGVLVTALGDAPGNRIHPHYGVFSPLRGEYIDLVASTPFPGSTAPPLAFDIGTGTGVLAAVLARRGVVRVLATECDARALACARDNIARMGLADRVAVEQANLFPDGRAPLVVCNPPWLPARASSSIEHAIYDEGSRMLLGFLGGLAAHMTPGGEGWLILSDLAEHLDLRSRAELLAAIAAAGLVVAGRIEVSPTHPKASDADDPLHQARSLERTSLWRLQVAAPKTVVP